LRGDRKNTLAKQPALFHAARSGIFSEYYLEERLPSQPFWRRDGIATLHEKLAAVLVAYKKVLVPKNEENTRNDFIDVVLNSLGYAFHRETATQSGAPDYTLFFGIGDKQAATPFYKKDWARFYGKALTILEAKYWERRLENVVKEDLFGTSDASGQLVRYLMDVDVATNGAIQWGILTNGRRWRLFWNKAKNRVTNYYEVDLEEVLANPHGEHPGSFDAFKRFVLFFEPEAFKRDPQTGLARLDLVARGSEEYSLKVADSLREKIFDPDKGVFIQLARGFASRLQQEENRLPSEADLDEIFHGTMTLLYRLLFLLFAESRDLLPTHERGYGRYALSAVCAKAQKLSGEYGVSSYAEDLWNDLLALFKIIERGDKRLNVPVYNGGLFKSEKGGFFSRFGIRDADLAKVLIDLTRDKGEGGEPRQIDYQALGVRQLGSIYEGLLEFRLCIANEPQFAVERGGVETWVHEPPPGVKPTAMVQRNQVYLATDKRERRVTGSYYTPDFIVKELVKSAVLPVFQRRCEEAKKLFASHHDLLRQRARARSAPTIRALEAQLSASERGLIDTMFTVRVLDPAMGSGHFLVESVDALSSALVAFLSSHEVKNLLDGKPERAERNPKEPDPENPVLEAIARQREAILAEMARQGVTVDAARLTDSNLIKRMVMKRCVFGVDLNPMAVELAKVSLWLDAFTLGAPLSFLDHHLKAGNSLVGTEPEAVERRMDGHLWMNEFAGMLAATDILRKVGELSDVTLSEVGRSLSLYAEAERMTAPFKAKLDVALAERFGAEKAGEHLDALEALQSPQGGKKKEKEPVAPEVRALLEQALAKARQVGFFHWPLEFPEVFYGASGRLTDAGFDAVVGNPPWERIKLQENEFFAQRSAAIAYAPTAAARKRLIAALQNEKSPLRAEYEEAKEAADGLLDYVRSCGDFPLMGKGDTNLYAVFTERAASLVKPDGRCSLVVPSGIATDKTTSDFFKTMVEGKRLGMLLDFENRDAHFAGIHRSFKYTLIALGGSATAFEAMDCGFFLHGPDEMADPERRFTLTAEDFARFNPNTFTSPIFRTRKDAEITRKLYAAAPILIRHKTGKSPEANPWKARFMAMFHMTNDSGLFRTRDQLEQEGFWLGAGNVFTKGNEKHLPLYEGKMVQLYDHRAASVEVNPDNLHRPAQPRATTASEYADPTYSAMPQFWVAEEEVRGRLGDWEPRWFLSFKDVCAPTNARTVLSAFLPVSAVGNNQPLLLSGLEPGIVHVALQANLACIPFDFAARQKVGGQHLNFFIVEQLPVFPPEAYEQDFHGAPLLDFILPRVLELTYTANDMGPFARDMGYDGPPFKWDEERRFHLQRQLDALFFILYGLDRDEADYVLSTFPIVKRQDEAAFGRYRSRDLILAYMAAYAAGNLDAWAKA
jgi:hypothetical protein